MNAASHIYHGDFRNFKELPEAGAEEELAVPVDILMCDSSNNVKRQSKRENTSHDVFGLNDRDNLGDLAKKLIKSGGHGNVFCSALQFSTWWQRI